MLPSIRPPQPQLLAARASTSIPSITLPEATPQPQPVISSETLLEIQSRLQDTQSSLASHVDKIRTLETILTEQDALKREMHVLRDMMESRERELLLATTQRAQEANREKDDHPSRKLQSNFDDDDEDDGDDAWSMATITVGGLERVDERDEDRLEQESQQHLEDIEIQDQYAETDKEKHQQREELGRSRTPEPTMGMHAAILNGASSHQSLSPLPQENAVPAPANMSKIYEQVSALLE